MKFVYLVITVFLIITTSTQSFSAKNSDTLLVNDFLSQARDFQYQNPDSTLYWSLKAGALAKSLQWKSGIAKAYFYAATAYRVKTDFAMARVYFDSALSVAQEIENNIIVSYCYNSLGYIYQRMADYANALSFYHLFYKTSIANRDTISQAIALNNIGIVHYYQKQYTGALEYYEKAVDILQTVEGGKIKIASNYNNIGTIHQEMKNYGLALEFYNKALLLHLENDYKPGLINVYNNLGSTHRLINEPEKAIDNIMKSIELSKQLDDKFTLASAYNELGMVHVQMENWENAIEYFNNSIQLGLNINASQLLLDNYQSMSNLYKNKGEFEKALDYVMRYNQLKDSVFSQQKAEIIDSLNLKFQAGHLANKNLLIAKERSIDKYVSWRNWFVFVIICLLIVVGLLVFRLFKLISERVNLNNQLKQQVNIINKQQAKIKIQSRRLSSAKRLQSNQQNRLQYLWNISDKVILLISGDFNGSLSSVIRYLELINQDKLSVAEIHEMAPRLLRQLQSTSSNWQSLMLWYNIYHKQVPVNFQELDLAILTKNIVDQMQGSIITKDLKIIYSVPEKSLVLADHNIIQILLKKLLTNAIHFTESGNEIDISVRQIDDMVSTTVSSIGVNIHEEMMDPMFSAIMSNKSNDDRDKITEFDLSLCEDLVKLCQGHISISNKTANSATFTFNLLKSSISDAKNHQEISA